MNLTSILNVSYKRNCTISGLLCLAYSIMFSTFIHVVACIRTSFLWSNNILLYTYATFCVSSHLLMNIWVVSTFWLLWIMLQWIFVYKYLFEFPFSILLGKCLGVELLGHMVILCIAFWGTTKLFSIVAVPFYISIRNAWGFQFLYILANVFFFVLLITAILVGIKWFCLHFPNDQWCLESFHVFISYLYVFFGEMSIQVRCSFFKLNYLFVELYEFFIYLRY